LIGAHPVTWWWNSREGICTGRKFIAGMTCRG
jgi:hypothetical protein